MGQSLITPNGPPQPRLQQIEEVIEEDRLHELLRKKDWTMLAMYPRPDQVFDGEMHLIYVMGKVGP